MLWVDVDTESSDDMSPLWRRLGVEDLIDSLPRAPGQPSLMRHNGILRLTVTVIRSDEQSDSMTLECLVAKNWVVTMHAGDLSIADEFNEPFDEGTHLGSLDGPSFLSLVLDWQIGGYFRVLQTLQEDVDKLDEELLKRSPNEPELLHRLQRLRSRVRLLRNTLGQHREVLSPLAHPESDAVLGAESAYDYKRLEERLERALDGVDTTREMIVGSFDIFMTRTAQATNDVVRRLTVVSVLLLPAVVIAGIMGMNFKIGLFDRPWAFWVVLAAMAGLAGGTLLVAKRRKWL
jgi:Mg2+ and Co2+ transporter CorA